LIDNRWLLSQGGGVDLDTALVRAFVETAEQRHFGRAARRLYLSQQALSKRIARLEEVLGVTLLERTNRAVDLTPAGKRFLPYARDMIEAVDAATAAAGIGDRPLRVDVMDEHASATAMVRRAADREPDLNLEVIARGPRSTAIEALRGGDCDVAYGRAYVVPWPADIQRRCVLLEPVGLLVSVQHPLSSLPEVPAAQLAGVRLRFPMRGAPEDWVTFVDELADALDIRVDPTGSSIGFEHFLDRTAEDPDTATFFGLSMRPPPDERLRVVPIVTPTPVFPWAVMWRRRVPESVVNRLTGPVPAPAAENIWLPAPDRAWLGL
jgi:DNA-binding transcriptional LysR family regulator